MIAEGKLGKFGKILDTTPEDVKQEFTMQSSVAVKQQTSAVKTVTQNEVETLSAAAVPTSAGLKVINQFNFFLFEVFLYEVYICICPQTLPSQPWHLSR